MRMPGYKMEEPGSCMRCVKEIRFFLLILPLFLSVCLFAQQKSKRLILKDGSYQMTTQWEVKGDRVRFYSSERYDWEELPTILVDWNATEKFNRDLEAQPSEPEPKLHKNYENEDLPTRPETPAVAAGLSLPDYGGVFLLDTYKNQPQLVELAQNGGDLNRHTSRNILRAAVNPLSLSSKQTIELDGARAPVQAHVTQPVLYVQVESEEGPTEAKPPASPADAKKTSNAPDSTHQALDRYRIVRLQSKKDIRVVGDLNVGVTGKISQKENWIKTSSTSFGEWVKITPQEPLTKGEYAVVELLEKGEVNLFVWDFGVDASAPANPNARTAELPAPDGKATPPELKKH